jgi:LEA14-like dessication related protein
MHGARAALVFILGLSAAAAVPGCATLGFEPPSLLLDKVQLEKARLSGMGIDVAFRVRNPNPDPILLEGFHYELALNGVRMGDGYYPEVTAIGPLREERILSRFELNWLSLPVSVRRVLEEESVRARVRGTLYVRQGARRAKALRFDAWAGVSLR